MPAHKDLTAIHRIHNWEYANSGARTGATGFTSGDIGKIAKQLDNDTLWQLTATTPTWKQVDGGGGSTLPVDDTTAIVQDPVDNTKQMRIDAGSITTGNTRVLTMPDADITPDDQSAARTPTAHTLGGSAHSADTLANLNSKVSDATLDDSSAERTPAAHDLAGAKHNAATLANLNTKVSDADLVALAGQLGGTAASPDVRGLRETGGPTLLTMGAVADGANLKRDGSTIVGNVWGSQFQQASSDTESSYTGSTTYQQKLRMTTPSLPAGTYRIGWSYEWSDDDENKLVKQRVQLDDTTTLHEMSAAPKKVVTGTYYGVSGFQYVSLSAAAHNIDIDYGTVQDNTAYIRRARLEIWRVS